MKQTVLKRTKGLKSTSVKTLERNGRWRLIVVVRAQDLIQRYGFLICEWSGEAVRNLTSVPDDPEDAWGHHIDGNRNNCTLANCYIVKYKYHQLITDQNIKVEQEDFQGRIKP